MAKHTWRQRFLYPGIVLAGLVYLASPWKMGIVCGDSMSPSFTNGCAYVLDQSYYRTHPVSRGDVVVFKRGNENYIKRVVATGGDKIYLLRTQDSDCYELVMDWQLPLLRRITKEPTWKSTMKLIQRTVPADTCFVVGDHVLNSTDSRNFGPILESNIRGKVVDAPPPVDLLEHVAARYNNTAVSRS